MGKQGLAWVAAFCAGLACAVPPAETVRLEHAPDAVLRFVASQMNVALRHDVPLPSIHLESATALERFQDAVGPQWGFRPPRFANAYVVATNEIYLTDDASYYLRLRRTLDESLAHEYVHYLQVRYLEGDLDEASYEQDAVAVQGRLRERIALGGRLDGGSTVHVADAARGGVERKAPARRWLRSARASSERFGVLVRAAVKRQLPRAFRQAS
jgi:hypothetical protein